MRDRHPAGAASGADVQVEPWPEVERRFREDPRWLGGDDAYSVPLGDGRHLWLFGDTFIAGHEAEGRRGARLLNNSVAIQTGDDLRSAELSMRWRIGDDGAPLEVFTDPEPGVFLWPAHGAVVEGRLVLFFMRVRGRDPSEPLGPEHLEDLEDAAGVETLSNFVVVGWSARLVRDASGDPLDWRVEPASTPATERARLVGAAVMVEDGHLYTHALAGRGRRAELLLVRWPVAAAAAGDLRAPSWWGGDGWVPDEADAVATGLTPLTEFTVHRAGAGRYVAVGLVRPRSGLLGVRTAPALWGPWSEPEFLYEPPLARDPKVLHYAGKAHPFQDADGDLLVTYASNGTDLATVIARDELYYPRCLRLRGSNLL